MPSAGKRVRACIICQGRLPAGSRIDRQYCGQACSDRAYYKRHPDKKRVLTARTRKAAESESRTLRQAGEATRKLAQLDADNLTLRRQLEVAQKQIADLKSVASTSLSRPPAPGSTQAAALTTANQKIAALTAKVLQASDDAKQSDAQLAQAYEEIEELRNQLIAAKFRAERAEQVVQSPSQIHRHPTQVSPVHAALTQPVSAPRKPSADPRIDSQQRSVTNDRPFSQSSADSASPFNLASHHAPMRVDEPLPWERPAKQLGEPPIPRWQGMPGNNFEELREFSAKTLDAIPDELYDQGDSRASQAMRTWLNYPENVEPLKELSFRIVLMTVSTERSQRRNRALRDALSPLLLDHAIKTMLVDEPTQAQEIAAVLASQRVLFQRLVFELIEACRGKELLHNEQRGTWRFFVRAPND